VARLLSSWSDVQYDVEFVSNVTQMTRVRVEWPGCCRAGLMYGMKFVTRVTQVRDTCDSREGLRYSTTSSSMRGSKFVENA